MWFNARNLTNGTLVSYNRNLPGDEYGHSLTFSGKDGQDFLYAGPNENYEVGVDASEFEINQWYHTVFTCDESAFCKLYVNGVEVSSFQAQGEETFWRINRIQLFR